MVAGCHVKPEQFFNLIFSYYDAWNERQSTTNAAAGTNILTFSTVPSDEVWVLTNGVMMNATNNYDYDSLTIHGSDVPTAISRGTSPVGDVADEWNGWVVLAPGYHITADFYGCTAGDDLYAWANGFKMKLSQ